jgi:hypothetical protein
VLGPLVAQGNYDLIGADGRIILPQAWEYFVQPDWSVAMYMWPMPKPLVCPLPSLPSISNKLQNIVQEAKNPKSCAEANLPNFTPSTNDKRAIWFKDCVGRKYTLPFNLVITWAVILYLYINSL